MKLSGRLLQIKGLRPVSKWEREVGIPRGNLDRAIKENKLSNENAIRLLRSENVKLEWLLSGIGAPYHVSNYPNDYEMAQQIDAYHEDEAEGWTVTIICCKENPIPSVIVLSMPVQWQRPEDPNMIDITQIEILTGPFGLLSFKAVCQTGWFLVQSLKLDDELVLAISKGLIGTYKLISDPGYLKQAEPIKTEMLFSLETQIFNEPNPINQVALTDSEFQFLAKFRQLNKKDKQRLLAICDVLRSTN